VNFTTLLRARKLAVVATLSALLLCVPAYSQSGAGAIQGAVFDQSGGAIAGATVTVTDVARGLVRTLTTDSSGAYAAPNVNPGLYTVKAEAKGFQVLEHTNVQVEVSQTVRVDLTLQPGAQNQTITVSSEAPSINTTDATLGGDVSNNLVNSLPLNGRNFQRLIQLHPGVVTTIGSGTGNGDYTNGRRGGDDLFRVEGIATVAQTAGLSGVLNGAYRSGDSSSLFPIDAIQEFSTEQNPKAQDGWKEGSTVSIGVKSGTNSIHGTAYAFGRDASATDATNPFSPGHGATPATLEQFGATAGGPIVKDKIFWFAGYEGLRDSVGDLTVNTIPTDMFLATDTSNTVSMVNACNFLASTVVIPSGTAANVGPYNAIGVTGPNGKVSALSAQLAGITINPATGCSVSPSSSSFENLFPYNPTSSTSFNPPLTTLGPLNNGVIKGDYAPGPHNHISGMYFKSESIQTVNQTSGELLPMWELNLSDDSTMFEGAWTWTPNSTWVNDVRFGDVYFDNSTLLGDRNMLPSNPYPSGYGMPTGVTNPAFGGLPEMTFTGFTGVLGSGTRGPSTRGPEGSANLVDNVSYLHGKHSFKFGFEYVDIIYDGIASDQAEGQIKFSGLQPFLSGTTNGGTIIVGNAQTDFRSHWFGGFFQDDWRITPKVILNLGLRYEYEGSPVERGNFYGNFDPNVNPATTSSIQQFGPGLPISSLFTSKHNAFPAPLSPRVGVAWDVRGDGRTVVRAGVSILSDYTLLQSTVGGAAPFGANIFTCPAAGSCANPTLVGSNNSGTALNLHTPDIFTFVKNQLNSGWNTVGPIFPISNSQTISGVTYTGLSCTPAAATVNNVANSGAPCATTSTDPNIRRAHAAEWNLDFERAITNSLAVDIAYVGNFGFNEIYTIDLNRPALGAGYTPAVIAGCIASASDVTNGVPTPYDKCGSSAAAETGLYSAEFPYLNYINQVQSGTTSNYNALQVTVNERVSHGLNFLAGYTWAHVLDDASVGSPFSTANLKQFYGNGSEDVPNKFTFSANYLIPGIKAPGQMLEGWSVSPLIVAQEGLPWQPSDSTTTDITGTGESNNTGVQTWNYSGPLSAFTASQSPIPCYEVISGGPGKLSGCTSFAKTPAVIQQECANAAVAPYAPGSQNAQLATAALANYGCFVQNGGILTPPAFGTMGNACCNLFRGPMYVNVDLSVAKIWKFRERYSAQFRAEFFNFLNRADYAPVPGATDPNKGFSGQFGCSCTTPDSSALNPNPVLGSGGPRHIQFGLKLIF
jgi:Carboxypeptidase regulatory-like domain